jgi:hypothetical protein
MADFNGQPIDPWSWVPPDWDAPAPADPLMVAIPEYSQGLPPPPPPPPPPVQRVGPGQPELSAPRAPSVENVLGEIAEPSTDTQQPGVPGEIEMPPDPATVGATLSEIAEPPAPQQPDPWQADMSPSIVDPEALQGTMQRTGDVLDAAKGEMLARDPLAYIEEKQKYLAEQNQFVQDELGTATRRDELAAERARARRNEAVAKHREDMTNLDQEWRVLANTPIDPGHWWSTRNTGQKFAAVLAAVVGGLVAGKTGGPNQGLDMILKFIERDIEAQKASLYAKQQGLQNRKGLLAESYALSGDEFRAEEAARLALYQRTINELQTRAQEFDPRGAQALKHAEMIMGVQQAQAKSLAEFEKNNLDRAEKMATLEGKLLDNEGKRRKAMPGPAPRKLPQAWVKQHYGIDPGRDVTEAELDKEIARRKGIKDLNKPDETNDKQAALEREQGIGGVPRIKPDGSVDYDYLRNKDGKVWTPPKERAPKILDAASGLEELTDALEQLKALRESEGGSNTVTSPGAQAEATRLVNKAVKALAKAQGLSIADKGSIDFTRDTLLGGDPTGYNVGDVADRITKSITEAKSSYITQLRQAGYNGDANDALAFLGGRQKPPPPDAPGEVEKSADKNTVEEHEALFRFAGTGPGLVANAKLQGTAERLRAIEVIGNRARVYKNPTALQQLEKLAKEAPDEIIREAAQVQLDRARRELAQ